VQSPQSKIDLRQLQKVGVWLGKKSQTSRLMCQTRQEKFMMTRKLLIAAAALSFIALPAVAQTSGDNKDGHHYSGGPRAEPHHMGKKETTGKTTKSAGGSHHYYGGPKSEVPHHMGPKKDQ
jgi:hypothetical protein